MAKAKILYDRVSIKSDILTDENLERVKILCPSALVLTDEKEAVVLYAVDKSDSVNTFNMNGACFKEGITLGIIPENILALGVEERKDKIETLLTASLTRINAIENQVEAYLDEAEDLTTDIEFLDFEEGEDE